MLRPTLVLLPAAERQLVGVPERRWMRAAALLLAGSLDRRLAAGVPPETGALLAVRAGRLVSPSSRRRLAATWAEVSERAARAPSARSRSGPINRTAIVRCRRQIDTLRRDLAGAFPVSARAVAMAASLLTDGTGPLHNPRLSGDDLADALDRVVALLHPAVNLDV